jgi:inorganic pyrophosphatase
MIHPWRDVTPGDRLPQEFDCVIEIPFGSSVNYELDKTSGLIRLDRALYSAIYYPANYGFIRQTFTEDDDPLDVLVELDEIRPPAEAYPIILDALSRYSEQRRKGFKSPKH